MDEQLRRWAHEHGVSPGALQKLETLLSHEGRGPATPTRHPERVLPTRYEDRGLIGVGGSAEVRRVFDWDLKRTVAMKVLLERSIAQPVTRARFLNEVRITGRLEHPGVVPVHDRGLLADGRPFFTMKEVRGRSFDKVLAEGKRDRVVQRRLLTLLLRVAETMAHAHALGVVHRDLKPANLMVGAFGEVMVMDWGIARDPETPFVATHAQRGLEQSLETSSHTRTGDVFGTIGYMSPEQARGEAKAVGAPSDVWSLGLVLYEVLLGERAYGGHPAFVLAQLKAGDGPVVPSEAPVPDDLREILERALAPESADRYPTAEPLRHHLQRWLDGEAQRERARAAVVEAESLWSSVEELAGRERQLREAASRLRATLLDHHPVERKRPLWDLEDEADSVAQRRAILEEERIDRLRSAIQEDPDNEDAHAELARWYRARLVEAERRQRPATAARYELLLRRHDRAGAHRAFLAREATLSLRTEPRAEVRARRAVHRQRRVTLEAGHEVGMTPLERVTIAADTYVLELRAEGCAVACYPIRLERGEEAVEPPPGEAEAQPVPLVREGRLGPDDIYVPGGWSVVGGDPIAIDGFPRRPVWLDGFVCRRFPVTWEDYLAFLDDLVAEGRADEAATHIPAASLGTVGASRHEAHVRRVGERYELVPESFLFPSASLRWPVSGVTWHDATAYARWEAARTGLPWRLLEDVEWEKAARGVDERPYPWGWHGEPKWFRVAGSTEEPAQFADVDDYPEDESPYGVRSLGGNIREWTRTPWTLEGELQERMRVPMTVEPSADELIVVRGGSWHTAPIQARSTHRFAALPDHRTAVVGFRLARSLVEEDRVRRTSPHPP